MKSEHAYADSLKNRAKLTYTEIINEHVPIINLLEVQRNKNVTRPRNSNE